jgi:hypothetical protein
MLFFIMFGLIGLYLISTLLGSIGLFIRTADEVANAGHPILSLVSIVILIAVIVFIWTW